MTIIYLDYVVPGSILIPIAVLLPGYRGAPIYVRILFWYLVVTALVNAAGIIMARNNLPNIWLIHILTAMESFLLFWFFSHIIKKQSIRTITRFLMIVFPLFCIINLLFIQGTRNFPSYTRPAEALLFIALCMIYWAQESDEERSWAAVPSNWFVTGLFLYFSGAFIIFLFSSYLAGYVSFKVMDIAWYTHATLILLMYILFAIGFRKCKSP